MRLKDKVVLITGAGSGIGRAMAEQFAAEGARLVLNDVNEDSLNELASSLSSTKVLSCVADVSDSHAVAGMMETTGQKYSRIDVLINNAGKNVRSDFRHMEDHMVDEVLGVNLNSTIYCTREAFPLLKSSGNACVINMSSVLGSRHMRQVSMYSAAKGAIDSLTRAMAVEFAPYHIRVNSIAPGFVETKLTERFTKHPQISKALLEQTPLRRFGQPEEIAAAAMFLASNDARYITGSSLAVDGGMSAGLV